ncbi:hypothetical protein [Rhodococcus sp. 4CII]|uniref:hypothetical protein n=1 Tax=Rhodococcus sp. 4CII TaxID=2834580 RepID=UPI0017E378BA|nr:hypothetical protein [Rhodococcus sp. 4CII]MBC2637582.1 hypothetical protein [Rhodococcus sp. 3A]MBC2644281.1 hypothetical protein [Rhodococcus sp. 3A]
MPSFSRRERARAPHEIPRIVYDSWGVRGFVVDGTQLAEQMVTTVRTGESAHLPDDDRQRMGILIKTSADTGPRAGDEDR